MKYLFILLAGYFFSVSNGVVAQLNFSIGNILFLGFLVPAMTGLYVYTLAALAGFSLGFSFLLALGSVFTLSIIYSLFFKRLHAETFTIWCFSSFLAFIALLESWTSVTHGSLGLSRIPFPHFLQGIPAMLWGGGVLCASALLLEFCFLQSPHGRALRAYKESPKTLDSMGQSSLFLAQCVLIAFPFPYFFTGFLWMSYLQFLTPQFLNLDHIVQALSIAVLALKPQVKSVVFASLFVFFAPELMRFLHLPETTFGHLRALFYSIFLLVLLFAYRNKLSFSKRFV